jgi:hypothetical protein
LETLSRYVDREALAVSRLWELHYILDAHLRIWTQWNRTSDEPKLLLFCDIQKLWNDLDNGK